MEFFSFCLFLFLHPMIADCQTKKDSVRIDNLSLQESYSSATLNYRFYREWNYEHGSPHYKNNILQSSPDNGKTWNTVLVFNDSVRNKLLGGPDSLLDESFLPDVRFFDDSVGIMFISSCYLYKGFLFRTDDGGKSWIKTREIDGLTFQSGNLHLINDQTALCLNGYVDKKVLKLQRRGFIDFEKTTDSGRTWQSIAINIPHQLLKCGFITDYKFVSPLVGYFSFANTAKKLRTEDGGIKWRVTAK
jgi:hypothetical protein